MDSTTTSIDGLLPDAREFLALAYDAAGEDCTALWIRSGCPVGSNGWTDAEHHDAQIAIAAIEHALATRTPAPSLGEALEPFAKLAGDLAISCPDETILRGAYWDFTAGDLRRAAEAYEALSSMRPVQEEGVGEDVAQTIDLDKAFWNSLEKAAAESSWIPPEYYVNDWVYDCCQYLRHGHPEDSPPSLGVEELREALGGLRDARATLSKRTYGYVGSDSLMLPADAFNSILRNIDKAREALSRVSGRSDLEVRATADAATCPSSLRSPEPSKDVSAHSGDGQAQGARDA